MSDESIEQAARRQHAIDKEVEKIDDRDTGHTLIGFGVFLGVIAGLLWLAGVDVPGPVYGVAILSVVIGLAYGART